jgi:YVTN family beta-propeller protein
MRSPAWTTQRSLAIITFDEDVQDGQHPAQRTPTIILGSAGGRQGYVSPVRYTHYSLLRTTEAALGLGTLTQNDRFAQPVNDIFSAGAAGAVAPPATAPAVVAVTRDGRTVYVANEGSGTVTPIDTATRRPGPPIKVGSAPVALAITPNERTIYVADEGSSTVTPIDVATNRPGSPITVGAGLAPSR